MISQALAPPPFVAVTQTPQALQALSFARLHDWGRNAYLTASGELAGLTMEWSSADGKSWTETEHCDPIPATMSAAREFGSY